MRIGNVALDGDGRPWITVAHLESQPIGLTLWHHDGTGWLSRDIVKASGSALEGRGLCDGTVTFDGEGSLYVAATAIGGNVEAETTPFIFAKNFFGHPSCEIVLLSSRDGGESFDVTKLSEADDSLPSWLPSVERPFGPNPIDGIPSVIYTHGGPGEGTTGGDAAEAVFARIAQALTPRARA